MDVYIFSGDIFCEECAAEIRCEVNAPDIGDSDDYPQGPFANGGGEADCPQHCGSCGMFLQNALTQDGDDYVRAAREQDPASPVVAEWLAFYHYL